MAKEKKSKITSKLRLFVQIFFFVWILLTAINGFLAENNITVLPVISDASLHGLCPFGGVVTLYKLFTEGSFVQKIHESSLVMLGVTIFLSIVFGPIFCGWICPLGTMQEWIGKIGKKLFKRRYNTFVPRKLDNVLRYFRYVVLVWIVYVTAVTGKLVFSDYDPYFALFNFWTGEVVWQAFAILGAVLVTSLFIERPWCKYACPLGAILGLFNKISIFNIRRNPNTCISCKVCDRVCPMNINVSSKGVIKDTQCIRCYNCTSEVACPVDDTVYMSTFKVKPEVEA